MQNNSEIKRIISIAGGGVAGIGPATFISRAEAFFCNALGMVASCAYAGNSVGSIIAALLAINLRGRDAVDLFCEHMGSIFGTKLVRGRMGFGPLYDDAYINDLLKKIFPMKLGSITIPIFITAWDSVKRDIKVFSSMDPKDADIPLWCAVRASMAAPTYFAPIGPYFDGGLCCNDPSMVACDAMRMLYGKDKVYKVAQFVTSGRQPDSSMPDKNEFTTTLLKKRLIPALTQGNSAHVHYSLIANGHYPFRLRPEHHDYDLADVDFANECQSIWDDLYVREGKNFCNWWKV